MQRVSRATQRCNHSSKPPASRTSSRMFAFASVPIDTLALPPFPLRPLFAVSNGTRSEPRAPPRSLPCSRRRRSPNSSVPPPRVSVLCQRPLACLLLAPHLAVSPATASERRVPLRLLPSSTRQRSPNSSVPPPHTFAFVSAPIDTTHPHPHSPAPAACVIIDLGPVEEPLSPRASRATRF